jgi:hypothetical protein
MQNRFVCSYALDRTSFDQTASGGNLRIILTTREWCPWTVTASERWLRVLTPSGTGSATISVDLEPQTSSAQRRAYLTVGGVRVDVLQHGT